ncbi:MAG: hypothetical protein ACRD4Y_16140, partial [Candidatus Acidiferrales bacterium]
LQGSYFQPNSYVTFNGSPLATSGQQFGTMQATITPADIAIPGTFPIAVYTPPVGGMGGGSSSTLNFTVTPVNLPPPTISQIAPGSAYAGGPAFSLLITGTGLASSSIVTFGSASVPVTGTSLLGTTLSATVAASLITTPGTEPVVVSNSAGISAPATFYIENPPPMPGGVSPPVVPAGSAALTLNITGSNFVAGSTVQVNGAARVTTFVSSTLLQATLLASDIAHGGTLSITVMSPGPGGGVSPAISLPISDYAVTAGSSTASVSAGQVATYMLTIAPSNGAYTNPVTFSATGLPAGASASFSQAQVTPGSKAATVMLSISTTARSFLPPGRTWPWPESGVALACLSLLALAFLGIGPRGSRDRLRRLAPQFALAALLALVGGLIACGNMSSSGSGQPGGSSTGTPPGAYTLVVTATAGTDVQTVKVTLNVM